MRFPWPVDGALVRVRTTVGVWSGPGSSAGPAAGRGCRRARPGFCGPGPDGGGSGSPRPGPVGVNAVPDAVAGALEGALVDGLADGRDDRRDGGARHGAARAAEEAPDGGGGDGGEGLTGDADGGDAAPDAGGVVAGPGVGRTAVVGLSEGAGGGPCAGRPDGDSRARSAAGGAARGGGVRGGAAGGGPAGGGPPGGGPARGGPAGRPGGGPPAGGRGVPGAEGPGPGPPSVPRASMTAARAPQHDRSGAAFGRRTVLVAEGTPLQGPVGAAEGPPDFVVDRRQGHGAHPTTPTPGHPPGPDHPDEGFVRPLSRGKPLISRSVDDLPATSESGGTVLPPSDNCVTQPTLCVTGRRVIYGKRQDMTIHGDEPYNAEPPRAALADRLLNHSTRSIAATTDRSPRSTRPPGGWPSTGSSRARRRGRCPRCVTGSRRTPRPPRCSAPATAAPGWSRCATSRARRPGGRRRPPPRTGPACASPTSSRTPGGPGRHRRRLPRRRREPGRLAPAGVRRLDPVAQGPHARGPARVGDERRAARPRCTAPRSASWCLATSAPAA